MKLTILFFTLFLHAQEFPQRIQIDMHGGKYEHNYNNFRGFADKNLGEFLDKNTSKSVFEK